MYLIKGISMYAHRARSAERIDQTVDRFTARALSIIVGDAPLDLDDFQELVVKALARRNTARALYEQSCRERRAIPEALSGPATMEFFTEKNTLAAQARGLSAKRLSRDQMDFYWESVCINQLGAIGTLVISEGTGAAREYDVSGFLHKVLDYLSQDLSNVELPALADQVEKARTKIVTSLLSGDTLVDIPSPRLPLSEVVR